MELSLRLQAVADMVTEGRRVADIGCDHGYVSIYLCKEKRCPKVIAMDVKKGPLERARVNIDRYGLSDYIEIRLSDGTSALQKGEVDTLLLSGMGGRLTIKILEQGLKRLGQFSELILQPQSEIFLVRAFLRQQGIEIVDENIVLEDGKFYPMIKAQPADVKRDKEIFSMQEDNRGEEKSDKRKGGEYPLTVEDYFGPVLLRKRPAELEAFLRKEKEKTKTLISQISDQERLKELNEYLSYIKLAMKKEKS